MKDRIFVPLESETPPLDLWWLSEHGIYRPRIELSGEELTLLRPPPEDNPSKPHAVDSQLLHPKYALPAECFAYVGDANKPASWKLPFLLEDSTVDGRRLPKAIQSILTNYRGARVSSVPEKAIPDVLRRLAGAAERIGKMPNQGQTADVYEMLSEVLKQVDNS